jgi:hypothetical protein
MNAHRSLPCQTAGRKERNNQPVARIRTIKNVEFKMCLAFAIHIHDMAANSIEFATKR